MRATSVAIKILIFAIYLCLCIYFLNTHYIEIGECAALVYYIPITLKGRLIFVLLGVTCAGVTTYISLIHSNKYGAVVMELLLYIASTIIICCFSNDILGSRTIYWPHIYKVQPTTILKVEHPINEYSYQNAKTSDRIFIRYKHPINGYNVFCELIMDSTLLTEPQDSYKSIVYIGTQDATKYIGAFTLNFNRNFDESDYGTLIEMEYAYPDIENKECFQLCEYDSLPFFFMDIDMDGSDEFIVRGNHDGSYQSNTYSVYDLIHYQAEFRLQNNKPFNELDSRSIIDFANNEITLVHKSGIRQFYFKYKNTDGCWQL